MIQNSVVETARLTIRPFEFADAAGLVAILADPQVSRFVGDGQALSGDDAALWVTNSRANLARYGYGTGAVIERSSGQLIGWAGFARPADGPEQIIYGLMAAHWRRGFGSEIVRALVDFATSRAIDPVSATVDPSNSASVALLTKHGFRLIERGFGGEADSDLYQRTRE
ncbi:GNAT family N-acetyltransferase [Sphingomonas jatrophae]|uniref:Protein N-acetyltransferase, RimJ/RimL family n=1 Tax=Sphingomonas jatrophae TaxID=1166337 RepID=A0A1I6JRQ5_9SPHN|nr:GNAT family N-acetyltransferase [Sphingomonas jatrophae]SFR81657.1 Protein N-acetyltransferase, RimJ/RimL family [Sphingomonas jatrophae]